MPRYIDAEKLKLSIIGLRESAIRNKQEVQVWGLNACEFLVETADTANVEEVRHGEIIKSGRRYPYCSECKCNVSDGFDRCPWCGAKFDGKESGE